MGLLLMLFVLIAAGTVLGVGLYVLGLLQQVGGAGSVNGRSYRLPPPDTPGDTQVGGYSVLPEPTGEPLDIPEETVVRVRQLVADNREREAVWLVQDHTGADIRRAREIVEWIATQR